MEIDVEQLEKNKVQHHVTFEITYPHHKPHEDKLNMEISVMESPYSPIYSPQHHGAIIPTTAFCNLFPYHILFDDSMTIKQCGTILTRMSHNVIRPRKKLFDVTRLFHPRMGLTFHHILRFINAVFMLEVKTNNHNLPSLILKGKEY